MTLKDPILKLAVGKDRSKWHLRFQEALEKQKALGAPVNYRLVEMDRQGWLSEIAPCEAVLWKPAFMGPSASAQFLAKIYYLEAIAGKLVVPNFKTVWHFENKLAQSYLLEAQKTPTPDSVGTFDYHDAARRLEEEVYPLVFKMPHGAASTNVRLVRTAQEARRLARRTFCNQLWNEYKQGMKSRTMAAIGALSSRWLYDELQRRLTGREPFGILYWQRFVPDNEADLRITVIGDKFAFGFWRRNRPGDFRASGSGRIDYKTAIPEVAVRLCVDISRRLGFDSMAYDILFHDGCPLVVEMSYGYLDSAIYNTPSHLELTAEGALLLRTGNTWPQELWVRWLLERVEVERERRTLS